MNKKQYQQHEKETPIKRSEIFNDILKIIKKLKLQDIDCDHFDAISATVELEKLFNSKLNSSERC